MIIWYNIVNGYCWYLEKHKSQLMQLKYLVFIRSYIYEMENDNIVWHEFLLCYVMHRYCILLWVIIIIHLLFFVVVSRYCWRIVTTVLQFTKMSSKSSIAPLSNNLSVVMQHFFDSHGSIQKDPSQHSTTIHN